MPSPTRTEQGKEQVQTCGDCGRDDGLDFLVATPIWNFVVGGQRETTLTIRPGLFDKRLMPRVEGAGGVLCLECFDRHAEGLGIEYRDSLIVFGRRCWMGGSYKDGVPLA